MKQFNIIYSVLLYSLLMGATVFAQTPISSYAAFQGYDETEPHFGEGEYQIFLDNVDGVLDKPLIIVDGFDSEDTNDIQDLYDFLAYGSPEVNYFDELRDQGVDIVILNFPTYTRSSDGVTINGGGDYIERNGLVLVNLIETINSLKVGTEESVIIGPSMGGLVTRYALTYMEQNALEHQAGLWVSFDAPHRGANIPISFQYAVNYLAVQTADADMIHMRDARLNSAASKQLLIDHYIPHLQSGSDYLQDFSLQLPMPNSYRDTFVATMNSLGFPTQTRNISIVNGSLNSTMVESPGVTIFNFVLDVGAGLGIDWHLKFTPDIGISDYEVDYIQPVIIASGAPIGDPFYAKATSPASSAGVDSCPGGIVEFASYFGSDPTAVEQQIIDALEIDAFSFIPTLSSMGVDEANWYNSIDGTESTPFDAFIGKNENQPHLTFDQDYVDFLTDEICNQFNLSVNESAFSRAVVLLGNPVKETLNLQINKQYKDLEIKIITGTGQVISNQTISNNQSSQSIPSPNVNGLYFLYISNGNNQIVKKFIVNR